MTGPREASVIATIQRNAKKRGAWLANLHGDGTGRSGLPDLVLCYRGRFVAVEAKRPKGGSTSALQRVELDRVRRAGGTAIVATSWRDVARALDAIDAELAGGDKYTVEVDGETFSVDRRLWPDRDAAIAYLRSRELDPYVKRDGELRAALAQQPTGDQIIAQTRGTPCRP